MNINEKFKIVPKNWLKSIPKGKKIKLEKVNINDYPELKLKIKQQFEDPEKYFDNCFTNKKQVRIKPRKTEKNLLLRKNSYYTKTTVKKKLFASISFTNNDIRVIEEKIAKPFNNKQKRRYINDKEIDTIFNNFKKGKNKNNKFIKQKTFSCIIPNNSMKDIILTQTPIKKISNQNIDVNKLNLIPNNKYIKKRKDTLYKQHSNNNGKIFLLKNFSEKILTTNKNNDLQKKELKKALVNQEITFILHKEKEQKFSTLCNYMSRIVKKPINNLLMNTENLRIKNDIKNKINHQVDNYYPEREFSWKNDLRKNNNQILKRNNTYNNIEIIRNPKYKELYNMNEKIWRNKENKQIDYLKKKIPKRNINNLFYSINNAIKNYKDLVVNGKSLLKVEYDICKSIKGKKIINFYEDFIKKDEKCDKTFVKN